MHGYTKADSKWVLISNEDELAEFCNFDEDLNGNNGEEYTMKQALDDGFNTSAEWIFSQAKRSSINFYDMVEKALRLICETDDSYLNYSVIDLGDENIIAGIIVGEN